MRSALLLPKQSEGKTKVMKQQYLPFTVCAEGCETAEEQRDDEGRTSQVPEQSEGKTKMMKQQYLPFTVLEHTHQVRSQLVVFQVATVPTVYGIETALEQSQDAIETLIGCNSAYRLRY